LAREHRRLGYSAAYCPRAATIENAALVAEILRSFAAEDVVIAEVGAWVNMLDPDSEKRRSNLQYVTGRLALSKLLRHAAAWTSPVLPSHCLVRPS